MSFSNTLPPNAVESEQAVLGCILLFPLECLPETITALGGSPDAFFDIRHQAIFQAMLKLDEAGGHIDLITVSQFLRDLGDLESCGGRGYLTELPDKVGSAAMIGSYLATVVDKWKLRRMVSTLQRSLLDIQESRESASSLIDKIEGDVIYASKVGRSSATTWSTGRQIAGLAIDHVQRIFEADGKPIGLSTGFDYLDKMTMGLQPTQYVCIAARPSMGKTSLAMNIAEHVAVNLRQPVGVFSLETSTELLAARLISSMAQVNLREAMMEVDLQKMAVAATKIAAAPLYINEVSMDMASIRSEARRLHAEHGLKLLVIDYLQLATSNDGKDRREKVEAVSKGLKHLAKELNIPIIVLAQLSREVEKQEREPQTTDLREAGGIEQDADVIVMLHRKFGPTDDRDDWVNDFNVQAIIRKQKQGPRHVVVPLVFHPRHTRFTSYIYQRA